MEKNDKKLEEFVDNLMKHDLLEQPSSNFTESIMSKIEIINQTKTIQYKPLIPKFVWWLIGIVVASVFGYVFIANPETDYSLIERFGISKPEVNLNLPGLSFSKTLVYSIMFLAVMLCVQIPLLKNYMDKRLSY